MSRASNLAGFSTSVVGTSPNNLIVGVITATSFVGDLTGSVTGNADTATTAGTATTANSLATNATGTNLVLSGDLTVNGTQTIINTTTLDISDKTVGIASTSSASNTTADGAGIVVYAGVDGDKSIFWSNTSGNWAIVGGGLSVTDYEGNFILDSYLFN